MLVRALALSILLLAACGQADRASGEAGLIRADRVFTGGTIYTGEGLTTVEAVAVADGRIVHVGALDALSPDIETIDLGEAVMFPGFTDSHVHVMGVGERERSLNLEGVASIAELKARVAEAAAVQSVGAITGRGWIETHWPEARFPSAADLDAVVEGRPVILVRADGHALVANSAALEAVGYDAMTPDPDGGAILKGDDGAPNGMIIDTAMAPFAVLAGEPQDEERAELYQLGAEMLAASGWTGVHTMSMPFADAAILHQLADEGRLPIRIYTAANPEDYAAAARAAEAGAASDSLVINRSVKLYVDGALGSRGAALLAPYQDAPSASGLLLLQEEAALAIMEEALRDGVQLAIHAIGDMGNRLVLDWMETAFERVPVEARAMAEPRWRIEHAQIVNPVDLPRFAELGVIASMQPSHAIGDLHFAPSRLGLQRLEGAYAWRDLLDSGAIIAGGSDAPVERGEARIEFYAATVRRDLNGFAGEGWNLDQAVSRQEALDMFTTAPAYASFREAELGRIAPGMLADFSVFDTDLMTAPDDALRDARPVMTVVAGNIAWRAN
ncbi:MAG: amidohydrolase [Pseudomonadota bacterium]